MQNFSISPPSVYHDFDYKTNKWTILSGVQALMRWAEDCFSLIRGESNFYADWGVANPNEGEQSVYHSLLSLRNKLLPYFQQISIIPLNHTSGEFSITIVSKAEIYDSKPRIERNRFKFCACEKKKSA